MSLSISAMLAATHSDGSGSCADGKGDPAGLPFEVLLSEQADAAGAEDATANGEVDAWFGAALEAAEAPAANRAGVDPLAGVLAGLGVGVRRLFSGNREIGDAAATLSALGKDKPANDNALLLLAAQNILQRLQSLQFAADARALSSGKFLDDASVSEDALSAESLARLIDNQVPSLKPVDREDPLASADSGSTSADVATELGDLLAKLATEAGPPDQAHASEMALSRQSAVPPGLQLAQAIHAALDKGAVADSDQGSNQPSTSMGFDRRTSKSAAPAIRVADPVSTFDSALNATAPASSPSAARLPNEDGVVSSLVQSMRLQMRDGVGTAVVHLEPDFLGAVTIDLRVENGAVTATLRADNPQVRAWMEANEGALRDSLAGQGLSLDRLLVTDERITDDRSSGRRHQQEQEQHARQRPRRDEASTFEVIV